MMRRCASSRDLPLERNVLHGTYAAPTRVHIAGILYDLDLWSGQKTGFYLDQVENYAAVAACAQGRRVLDCFTNQGAFALSAMRAGAVSCRAVDQSTEALRHAEATAKTAKLEVEWMQADVFDLLRHYEQKRETFDLVVLDPPSFTKSKGNKESACAVITSCICARCGCSRRAEFSPRSRARITSLPPIGTTCCSAPRRKPERPCGFAIG